MVSPDEFERIARENERRLYTDALFILRSHADAEDAAEEAIYRLFTVHEISEYNSIKIDEKYQIFPLIKLAYPSFRRFIRSDIFPRFRYQLG